MANAPLHSILRHIHKLIGTPHTENVSDAALLQRFLQQREEAAFAMLVRRHGPLVWSVCRRVLAQEQDAEDVFQATFLVLARKAGSIHQQEALAGWLYQVAYRIAIKAKAAADKRRNYERRITEMAQRDTLT